MSSLRRIVLLIAALYLVPAAAAGPAVYKWIDDGGVTHYTQQPPLGREAQRISPGSASGPARPAASPEAAPDGEDEQAGGDQPTSVAEFCQQVRERVEALAGDGPVSIRQEDGSLQRLDPEERARQLEQGRGQIAEHCQDEAAGSA